MTSVVENKVLYKSLIAEEITFKRLILKCNKLANKSIDGWRIIAVSITHLFITLIIKYNLNLNLFKIFCKVNHFYLILKSA